MKKIKLIVLGCFLSLLAQNVEAQFLQKLKKHAEEKIEQEANRRAERKVDEKVDEGFDKAEDELEKDRKKKAKNRKEARQKKHTEKHNQESRPNVAINFPTGELKAGTFGSNPYPVASSIGRLKRYDIRSGIVQYEKTVTGKVLTSRVEGAGAMSLYFKDWGAVELNEEVSSQTTTSKFLGKEKVKTDDVHSMARLNNGEVYAVDFERKQIMVRRDPAMDLMRDSDTDAGAAGERMLESIGGKKVRKESFLGYHCDVWEIPGGEQWMYKGVMLKLDMTVMGIRTLQVATSAKFNISVPEKYFSLPNYPLQKMDDYRDNAEYEKDRKENQQKMKEMSEMTYPEFKRRAKQDPEMKDMSDKELRDSYNLMKKMAKAMAE